MTLPTRASACSRNKKKSACRSYRKNPWFRPRLEGLEDRTLLSATGGGLGVFLSGANALAPSTDQHGQTQLPNTPIHVGATIMGLDSGKTVQPPSMFQAMLSLYLDGAFLEAVNVANQFIFANPDEYGIVDSVTTNINANAAAAGINLDAANHLGGFLEVLRGFQNGLDLPNPVSPETLALEDIQSNWPYAGPLALFALAAGVEAAYQAVQQPPSS
jgi:hypothetical protein